MKLKAEDKTHTSDYMQPRKSEHELQLMYLVNGFISVALQRTQCITCNELIPNTENEGILNLCYSSNAGLWEVRELYREFPREN